MSIAGAAAGGAAQVIADAVKASGAIVRVDPENFMAILARIEAPLVVTAQGGIFSTNYQYITGHKSLVFFTRSPVPLQLAGDVEVVQARKIWIPA